MDNAKQAIKSVNDLLVEITIKIEECRKSTNLPEMCKFYRELATNLDIIESAVKGISAVKTELSENILPDLMESMYFDSVKVGGYNFITVGRTFFSIPEEKRTKGFDWLRANGFEMLIKEGVNAQSLTAAINEYVDDKGEYPPEDVVTKHTKKYISMRKAK